MQEVIIIPRQEWMLFVQRLEKLETGQRALEKSQPKFISQPMACEMLGIKEGALRNLRAKPGSLIKWHNEGPNSGKPVYCVKSIEAHLAAKERKRPNI